MSKKEEEEKEEYVEDLNEKKESDDDVISDFDFEEVDASGDKSFKKELLKLKNKYEEKIKRLENEKNEYLSGWQRAQADYKNREKEIENFKKDFVKFSNQDLIRDIIPVFDGFDMAKADKDSWEKVSEPWRVGVEYLFSNLFKVLENVGLKNFGNVGEAYDPQIHEAVEVINLSLEEKEKNDIIMTVLQKGYKINDKIIRQARVKVGKFEE